MNAWKQCGLIVLLAAVAGVGSAIFHPSRPSWFTVEDPTAHRWRISPPEARQLAESADVLWIDSRTRTQYEEEHFPGAILLTAEEWAEQVFEHLDTLQGGFDRPVVVYCDGTGCARSREVAQRLRELLGLDPVYVLEGDWRLVREGEGISDPPL